MPRHRTHALDDVFDAVERLVVEQGREAVTVRAVASRAGISNGSLYHAFGSIENVLGRTWLRGARHFLDLQQRAVDEALAAGGVAAAERAVVAAAMTPAVLAGRRPETARFLVRLKRDDLLVGDLDEDLGAQLLTLDGRLLELLRRLSTALWDRDDAAALTVMTACVVDLPAALLFRDLRRRTPSALSTSLLDRAVRALVAAPPEAISQPRLERPVRSGPAPQNRRRDDEDADAGQP